MINVQEGQCDISGWNFRETCFKVLFEGMTVLGCMLMFLSTVAQQKMIIQIQFIGVWSPIKILI